MTSLVQRLGLPGGVLFWEAVSDIARLRLRPSQEKNVPMIGVEARAQWLASVEVVSGYFESVASCWAKCIRVEGGKVIFWDGLSCRRDVR